MLSFIWIAYSPTEVLTFVFYNDGSLTKQEAGEAVTGTLSEFMEEAKTRKPIYLKQETRFPLPLGALERRHNALPAPLSSRSLLGNSRACASDRANVSATRTTAISCQALTTYRTRLPK